MSFLKKFFIVSALLAFSIEQSAAGTYEDALNIINKCDHILKHTVDESATDKLIQIENLFVALKTVTNKIKLSIDLTRKQTLELESKINTLKENLNKLKLTALVEQGSAKSKKEAQIIVHYTEVLNRVNRIIDTGGKVKPEHAEPYRLMQSRLVRFRRNDDISDETFSSLKSQFEELIRKFYTS